MLSGTIYLDYLSRLAYYGLDTEVKTSTLRRNLSGTQSKGAGRKTERKRQQRDLRRGRARAKEWQQHKVQQKSKVQMLRQKLDSTESARATRIYKRQSTHLRKKGDRKDKTRPWLCTEGARRSWEKRQGKLREKTGTSPIKENVCDKSVIEGQFESHDSKQTIELRYDSTRIGTYLRRASLQRSGAVTLLRHRMAERIP
jgi:hypothetical protein